MNTISRHITGLQHLGIPTADLPKSIHFYEGLGFQLIGRETNPTNNQPVAFLQFNNLVMELYGAEETADITGSIDHIALDVKNIEQLVETVRAEGYTCITDKIEPLPFWENGIRYFIIEGPSKERIEFCERL